MCAASKYLEGGPLMWIMPLHLHVNKKSDYDNVMNIVLFFLTAFLYSIVSRPPEKRA